jgi:predicted DNA-binding transcriptional regulator AlpA
MQTADTPKTADKRETAAAEIKKTFDSLSEDILLDTHQTGAVLGVSVAALKVWRQAAQHGGPLRGPKPLIVGGSLVRYRAGDIREWLRTLAKRSGVVSTRGVRSVSLLGQCAND